MLDEITGQDVVDYLIALGKPILWSSMLHKNDKFVLAGGAVANALLSIIDDFAYPINDLDYFKQVTKYSKSTAEKENRQVTERWVGHYIDFVNQFLRIQSRDKADGVDIVSMVATHLYGINVEFPKELLKSFDLNCVGAAVYHNGEKFVLITTLEFDQFVKTRNVEIVNVHSDVTFGRLLKKTADLNAVCNVDLEVKIIQNARSVEYMRPMSTQQRKKHFEFETPLRQTLNKVYSLDERDMQLYEGLYSSKIVNARIEKIKVLRWYFTSKLPGQKIIRSFFTNECGRNILIYFLLYNDPEKFLEGLLPSEVNINRLETFLNKYSLFGYLFSEKTLTEMDEVYTELASKPEDFLRLMEQVIVEYEDEKPEQNCFTIETLYRDARTLSRKLAQEKSEKLLKFQNMVNEEFDEIPF